MVRKKTKNLTVMKVFSSFEPDMTYVNAEQENIAKEKYVGWADDLPYK